MTIEWNQKQIQENLQAANGLSRFQIYKERLPLAVVGAFEVFLGWVLMLVVMTFNASLLIAAVAGSFIGFLCFGKNGHDDCGGNGGSNIRQMDTESEMKTGSSASAPAPYTLARSILPRLIVVIFLIILFLWIYQAEGGIGFQEATVFGWHALLMSLFVVVFTQEALLAYSSPLIGYFTKNRTIIK
jgi:hypothetical protein